MAHKGKFIPQNPNKYIGNPREIVYRSSWELRCMKYFDQNPNVIKWASEEVVVKYQDPFQLNKIRRYFPDFIIEVRTSDKLLQTYMVEVKPYKETKPPEKRTKKTPRYLREVATWRVNKAKWQAAEHFCAQNGWQFIILHEKNAGFGMLPTK